MNFYDGNKPVFKKNGRGKRQFWAWGHLKKNKRKEEGS